MYHVSAQGVDERMMSVHYYYYKGRRCGNEGCVEKMRGEGCRRYGNEVYGEFEG